jgi:hypothetical protein
MQTKTDVNKKVNEEKTLIYKFERQAQDLELEEERLIKRLQSIQDEEKAAFAELEQAMITASLAKKDRLEIVDETLDEHLQ